MTWQHSCDGTANPDALHKQEKRELKTLYGSHEASRYRRLVKEVEIRQPSEVWTLAWHGCSEVLLKGCWHSTQELVVFGNLKEAVVWLQSPLPTWH